MAAGHVTLLPAVPRQAAAAAALIAATGPAMFRFAYEGIANPARVLGFCYRRRFGTFSHRFATAAVAGGRMVGIELGYDRRQKHVHNPFTTLFHLAQLSPARWVALKRRAGILDQFMLPPAAGEYYVLNLAVAPEFRGCGVGARLLGAAFDRAARLGYTACTLDVATTNEGGYRFYTARMGMVEQQRMEFPEIQRRYGLPGSIRMVKYLDASAARSSHAV